MSFAESNGVAAQTPMHQSSSVASDGGTEPYYPLMPPTLSSSSPSPPPPAPPSSIFQLPSAAAAVSVVAGDSSPAVSVDPTSIEPAKRKRGRPRKYAPDYSPSSLSVTVAAGGFNSPAEGKKARGRPPGSGKKQQLANLGSAGAGTGFRVHVITPQAGEDVLAKLMSFSQSTSQAVCILSAHGSISNVTLSQATISGGTVTYEGQFEILSLSGSFLPSEFGGERSRTGSLGVVLAEPDGKVLGGVVAGVLIAASAVQVIVGSFSMEGQRQLKLDHSDAFGAPSTLVSGASAAKSSSSLGTLSESSGEPVSPHNQLVETSNNSPPVVANSLPWR